MSVTGAHSERNRCSTQTQYSLSIPIYQQMARVIYVDRCMVKWAGMILSEHSEQMKDQEGYNDGTR